LYLADFASIYFAWRNILGICKINRQVFRVTTEVKRWKVYNCENILTADKSGQQIYADAFREDLRKFGKTFD